MTPMTPNYQLFLDDEREPSRHMWGSIVVRSYDEAVSIMLNRGCPTFISFDHDLGPDEKTGYDLAKWLVERDLDSDGAFIPATFEFYVHSQNPVGAANIRNYLQRYLKYKLPRTSTDTEPISVGSMPRIIDPDQKG